MTAHLIWAAVVLVIVAAVVIERRRGRLSADAKTELEREIATARTLALSRSMDLDGAQVAIAKIRADVDAIGRRNHDTDVLRDTLAKVAKDVTELKAQREREGLGKLRGA